MSLQSLPTSLPAISLIRAARVFEEVPSTNDLAAEFGRAGEPGGLAIFAEKQTAGRGRHGRRWESAPRQGLWFSLLLRPALPMAHWPRLTTWAAVAVAEALEAAAGYPVGIKWPNDLWIRGRKVTGILTETFAGKNGFVVAGIGINANQPAFPPPLDETATSLAMVAGREFDLADLAIRVLRQLDARFAAVECDFSRIVEEARERNALEGKLVTVSWPGTELRGTALDLDENGALLVALPDGTIQAVTSGEATLSGT